MARVNAAQRRRAALPRCALPQNPPSERRASALRARGMGARISGRNVRPSSGDSITHSCTNTRLRASADVSPKPRRSIERSGELGVEHQLTLARFGGERLLYRLSKSEFVDRFILKGAALLLIWLGEPIRPAKDVRRGGRLGD